MTQRIEGLNGKWFSKGIAGIFQSWNDQYNVNQFLDPEPIICGAFREGKDWDISHNRHHLIELRWICDLKGLEAWLHNMQNKDKSRVLDAGEFQGKRRSWPLIPRQSVVPLPFSNMLNSIHSTTFHFFSLLSTSFRLRRDCITTHKREVSTPISVGSEE